MTRAGAHDDAPTHRSGTTLVLGGARSGKSAVAEALAARAAGPAGDVTYLATAANDPADADMRARIDLHRGRRPAGWRTVEVGADLVPALRALDGPALVDSLGTWVAAHPDLDADGAALAAALRARAAPTVVVAEEVGGGLHPPTEVGRRFRDVLGTVNQQVAEVADEVLLVVAGRVLPLPRWEG
jgi:adenosylcobinamide kinase/adenosylcobinamide-phosphate guanylyltransferase